MILAEIFAGAIVHFLVRIWRPRQVSAYRTTQLQARLEALANAIGTESSRGDYDRLLARLHHLADGIDIDLTTDQELVQLETDITELQKKLATAASAAGETIKQQQKALDQAILDLAPYLSSAKGSWIRSNAISRAVGNFTCRAAPRSRVTVSTQSRTGSRVHARAWHGPRSTR